MRRLRAWFVRLGGLFNKERAGHAFAQEMESHLQMHIDDNVRSGMTADEARRNALIKLGGVAQTKEIYGERRGIPAVETLLQDLRFAVRMLLKNPGFTVVEFVEYFALLKEMPAARVPAAVATAVEWVDLGGQAKAKLRTLSGGMLRRVGIAQAIVNEPELLLLDEPTAGLDPEQRVHFRALLRDLGQHATVVVSTHLVEDVGAACSEVTLMDQGKIVFHGTPAQLTARGTEQGTGDAPLERGYTAVLAAARA